MLESLLRTDRGLPQENSSPWSWLRRVCWTSCICFTGCASQVSTSEPPREVWRFAIEESAGSVQHAYAVQFKKLIEQQTDGEVEVVVYPYGTLGTSTQITEQLNLGAIEFAMASPGSLGKFIPELQVFLLHFVLPSTERGTRQLLNDPELLQRFNELYQDRGLQLLSMFSEGAMVWTTQDAVRQPDDFRGVKMRVMTSPILLAAYNAYGASATPMPYSEVYSGLQLNMIDGQVNPVFAIERQKFYEVTRWMTFPGHTSFVTTCAANHRFFRDLSPQRQKLVQQVIQQLDEYIFRVQTSLESQRLKEILRNKKAQQSEFHLCGDLQPFLDSLTPQEHQELILGNSRLEIHQGLTSEERRAFRELSRSVQEVFLKIGGPQSREILSDLRQRAQAIEGTGNSVDVP